MTRNNQSDATLARVAATASALAGLVHYAVVPEHRAEWWAYAAFFTALAIFNVVWAVAAWTRPDRPTLLFGLTVNVGVVALWAVSRTAGLPFGPEPGEAEAVGIPDAIATAAELVLVLAVAVMARRSRQPVTAELEHMAR